MHHFDKKEEEEAGDMAAPRPADKPSPHHHAKKYHVAGNSPPTVLPNDG
jgi:hypothetical protein